MDPRAGIGKREAGSGKPTPVNLAALVVILAATLPYLSTLNNYFVRDDFGVVQLLASKPASYFPQWFVSSWMDDIWGSVQDEIRPFPAVSYQLTALAGAASPWLHHALNIALHALNGLLVFWIGLSLVRLSLPGATLAATLFVVLPVHSESVAWITGRVDSMPACFYMASFLAFARWRAGNDRPRSLYAVSLGMLFVALFTKQTTITMIGTLVAWDVLTTGWPASWSRALRVYAPFVLMTTGYLALRYVLFGQVVRESQLNLEGLRFFASVFEHHLAHVVAGRVSAGTTAWLMLGVLAACAWLLLRGMPASERRHATAMLVFFGPIWWAIGVAPTLVAPYESPRHVYLAAVGWAIVLGLIADLAARGESPASTETGEAPRPGPPPRGVGAVGWGWRSATTENIGQYLKEEQRGQTGVPAARVVRGGVERGCIAGRMPRDFHRGLPAWVRARHPLLQRVVGGVALTVVALYVFMLHGVVAQWNRMAAVSHQAVLDVEREAIAAGPGSLIIAGAPVRSWEWAMPFAVKPPFARVDLTQRALVVTPRALQCCRSAWFDETRRMLREWSGRASPSPVVVLRWDPDTGALSRLSDREYPALGSVVRVLPELASGDALDANILRIISELTTR